MRLSAPFIFRSRVSGFRFQVLIMRRKDVIEKKTYSHLKPET
jgi:hypothetical protein